MKKYCMMVVMVMMQTVHASDRRILCLIGPDNNRVFVSKDCRDEFNGKLAEIVANNYTGQVRENVLNKLYNLSYKLAGSELDRRVNGLSNDQINPVEIMNFHQCLTDAMYAKIFELVDPRLS